MLQDALQILNERERHILTEGVYGRSDDARISVSLWHQPGVFAKSVRAFEKLQKAIRNAAIKNNTGWRKFNSAS